MASSRRRGGRSGRGGPRRSPAPSRRARPGSPEPAQRRIVMLGFPGAQILDITGPLEVFAMAAGHPEARVGGEPAYRIELAARDQGPLRCSSGLELVAGTRLDALRGPIDTLLVAGGEGVREAYGDDALLGWIARAARRSRRVAGVCSGAFLLARAGLLDGRRATTHWANVEQLARMHPLVRVEGDCIYVKDGPIYTSAGVTAGMDLALALVEEDHGRSVALAVARRLVLFLKRPGGQSQFSTQLQVQVSDRSPLRELQSWIAGNPTGDLSVEALARRVGMSPRHFARVFARELGVTPARYVERARVEVARRRLEETALGVEAVAAESGFGSAETLRRAFLRNLSVGPLEYRNRFRDVPGDGPQKEVS